MNIINFESFKPIRQRVLGAPRNAGNRRVFSIALKKAIVEAHLRGGLSTKGSVLSFGLATKSNALNGVRLLNIWIKQYRQGLFEDAYFATHTNQKLNLVRKPKDLTASDVKVIEAKAMEYAAAAQALVDLSKAYHTASGVSAKVRV